MDCIICKKTTVSGDPICIICQEAVSKDAEVIRIIKENCVSPAQPITREDALAMLKEAADDHDTESAHSRADDVLCDLLETLGYGDIVATFHQVKKWYA